MPEVMVGGISGSLAGMNGGAAGGGMDGAAGLGFGAAFLTATGFGAVTTFFGAAFAFFATFLTTFFALAFTFPFAFTGRVFFFAALVFLTVRLAEPRLALAFTFGRFFDLLFFAMVNLLLRIVRTRCESSPEKVRCHLCLTLEEMARIA
jgi:hypothetical protein